MKTSVLFTVDTEVAVYNDGFDPVLDHPGTHIEGRIDQGEFGIETMMDAFRSRSLQATFFLDPFGHPLWGEEVVRGIANRITERGFDIQLHTHVEHADWLTGEKKKLLTDYDRDEQVKILAQGRSLIETWTGLPVHWHRSGHLAVNQDTLDALHRCGFTGDASFCYDWASGRSLKIPALKRNHLQRIEGIWEVPVTTYRTLPFIKNYRHLDVNVCLFSEIRKVLGQAAQTGVPLVVLTLHSYSFVRRDQKGWHVKEKDLKRFERICDFVASHEDMETRTFGQLTQVRGQFDQWDQSQSGQLYTGFMLSYTRSLCHWNRRGKNRLMVLAPVIALFVLLLTVFLMT